MDDEIDEYLFKFKNELHDRLEGFYKGLKQLKDDGFDVDVIPPQAAIYLTVQFNLIGKKTETGVVLSSTEEVTKYLLNEAKLAIVPFYAFGASKGSTWYRLSVGTASMEDVEEVHAKLRAALEKLV